MMTTITMTATTAAAATAGPPLRRHQLLLLHVITTLEYQFILLDQRFHETVRVRRIGHHGHQLIIALWSQQVGCEHNGQVGRCHLIDLGVLHDTVQELAQSLQELHVATGEEP